MCIAGRGLSLGTVAFQEYWAPCEVERWQQLQELHGLMAATRHWCSQLPHNGRALALIPRDS